MPRIRGDPAVEARKADLRKLYGGFMTLSDISREIGCRSRTTAEKAVKTIPSYTMTGKKVYDIADVAMMIERSRVPAEVPDGTI